MRTKAQHEKLMKAYEGKLSKAEGLKVRVENLVRNAQTSKSDMTLADCEALLELARLAGFDTKKKKA